MMNVDDYKQVDGQVIINRAPIDLAEAQETFVFDGTAILRKDIERAKSWYLSEVDSEKSILIPWEMRVLIFIHRAS